MPNRILRDWTDSDRVDQLTAEAERFFVRLIMRADDYGRYSADLKRLKAFLFPLKDSLRETDCSRWLAECEKAGLVRSYEVTGKRYVEIADFRQRLRQMREIYPKPTSGSNLPSDDRQMTASCPPNRNEEKRIRNEQNGASESVLQRLEAGLNRVYDRPAGFRWTHLEQSTMAEIARRPDCIAELDKLLLYRDKLPQKDKRFFPASLGSLLSKWTDTLDRANQAVKPVVLPSRPAPQPKGQPMDADKVKALGNATLARLREEMK